jgi:predicted transcriptional regulator of viral defense system
MKPLSLYLDIYGLLEEKSKQKNPLSVEEIRESLIYFRVKPMKCSYKKFCSLLSELEEMNLIKKVNEKNYRILKLNKIESEEFPINFK